MECDPRRQLPIRRRVITRHSSVFRLFAQRLAPCYFYYQFTWIDELAEPITCTIVNAVNDMRRGWLGVDQTRLWGISSNRSLAAFRNKPISQDGNKSGSSYSGDPVDHSSHVVQKAVDPRVTTIVVRVGGKAASGIWVVWLSLHRLRAQAENISP